MTASDDAPSARHSETGMSEMSSARRASAFTESSTRRAAEITKKTAKKVNHFLVVFFTIVTSGVLKPHDLGFHHENIHWAEPMAHHSGHHGWNVWDSPWCKPHK